jgi:twinkle protein
MRKEIEELFDEIVLVFDNDEAGDKAVREVQKVLPDILEAPHLGGIKDANEALSKGKQKEFVDFVMWKARKPPIEGVITVSQTLERGIKPPETGLSYPWESLTKTLYGQRFGEAICVAGAVSSGKTLIAHEIAAWNMVQHGIPCFTALLEEMNHKTLWNIAAKIDSIPYNRPEVYEANKEQFHETISKLEALLFMWNSQGNSNSRFNMDEILAGIRFNVAEYGIKSAFIDNMTRLTDHLNTGEANEFINKYSSEVANLAEELGINIFLYSHLNPPKGNNVKSHEEGAEIFPSQLTGSRGVMRSFPTILGFERNQFAEGDLANNSYLGVLKSRDYGGKVKIKTQYSTRTGRLLEYNWEGNSLY